MYSALSGKYVNATTGNACKSNEINSRNVAGPVTPHQNSLRHLGIIHAQLPPHTFPSYLTGKGAGPTILVYISAPLIEMMCGSGHGIKFEAPLYQDKDSMVGFMFIDDTGILEGCLTNT